MRRIDPDRSGEVDYQEFVQYFAHLIQGSPNGGGINESIGDGKSARRRASKVIPTKTIGRKEAEKVLKAKIVTQFNECAKAFRSFDYDHSGTVDFDEFKMLLLRFNVFVHNDAEAHDLFKRMDPDGSGEIDYKEFLGYFGLE